MHRATRNNSNLVHLKLSLGEEAMIRPGGWVQGYTRLCVLRCLHELADREIGLESVGKVTWVLRIELDGLSYKITQTKPKTD